MRENLVTESTAKEAKRSLEYRPQSDRKQTLARELQCRGKSSAAPQQARLCHRGATCYQVQALTATPLQARYDSTVAALPLGTERQR